MADNVDGVDDCYDIVRRSDGAVACSIKFKPGNRVLLNSSIAGIIYKHLQTDERVISHETLVEIVKELSSSN